MSALNTSYTWEEDERSLTKLAVPTRVASDDDCDNLGNICKSIVLGLQTVPCYSEDEDDSEDFFEDSEEYWGDFDKPHYCSNLSRSSSFSSVQSDVDSAYGDAHSDYDSDSSDTSGFSGSKAVDVKYYYT